MKLRTAVPTLGALALAAALPAQEIAKDVNLNGWVDAKLNVIDQPYNVGKPVPPSFSDRDPLVDFNATAALRPSWKINDQVSAYSTIWFNNNSADKVNLNEAYIDVALPGSLTWRMGKFYTFFGLIVAEPTDRPRVNIFTSPVWSYLYTYDEIGTSLNWSPSDSILSAALHVNNGNWTGQDQFNDTSLPDGLLGNRDKRRHSLGLGLDLGLKYLSASDSDNVLRIQVAYDDDSSPAVDADGGGVIGDNFGDHEPGHVYAIALQANYLAQLEAGRTFKLASELIGKNTEHGTVNRRGTPTERIDVGGTLYAAYGMPDLFVPTTISAMYQVVNLDWDGAVHGDVIHEASLTVMTNPFGTKNAGINFEVAHQWIETDPALVTPLLNPVGQRQTTFALELLARLP